MAGWGEYAAAWAAFLLTHAVPIRPPVKPWLVAGLGRAGFGLAYSALSVGVLVWLIGAAARAPFVMLWPRAEWQNHVTLTAMILACLILALALGRPNPFSFGGWRNDSFDPARPGIVGLLRHPVLAALLLWSLGHVVPNGDLAHVLMFGGFAGFALLGMVMIDRRRRHDLGPEVWRQRLPARSLRGAAIPMRWLGAIVLMIALIALHPLVIGLPALW
ncbi:MAG: NnrU family protein [Paracoccaceae bacterium]